MKTIYTIKNFRVFDQKGVTVEISPLTFLVGCNSSGKSSIVKSLSLLKTFFMINSHSVIGSTIDFSVKPNDTLGSFNNVVNSSSREKTITLSYEVRSDYFNDDVVVSLTMGKGNLGNAIITGIRIALKDGTLIGDTNRHSGSLAPVTIVKEVFLKYLIATRYRSSVYALMPVWSDEDFSEVSKKEIQQLKQEALRHCDPNYLDFVYSNRRIESPSKNEYARRSIDVFANSGVMIYFSVLNEIGGLSDPEEVGSILKSKVKKGATKDALLVAIDHICKDFQKKKSKSFISYYRSVEDDYLLNPSIILNSGRWQLHDPNRMSTVNEIANGRYVISKIDFTLLYDVFSYLSEVDDRSETLENPFANYDEAFSHRIYPLYTVYFSEFVSNFLSEIVSKDITEGLDYISSSRIQVRRMYPMEDRNEFSDAVKRYFETKTHFLAVYPIERKERDGWYYEPVFVPGSYMSKWLKTFKIGDHMSLEMDKNGLGLLLKLYRTESDKKGVLLADMGYGITQLFSILLQIEEMIMSSFIHKVYGEAPFEPRTVAIEEPEIHLHPKYQSLLAEMFYEAYKEYNIQFIIETHSEYLLRKVQTLIGEKKLSPEEVSIIYVEDDCEVEKGAPKVRRIPIKDDGRLAEPFGPGFYDEADSLSMDLLRIKSDMA